MPWLTPRQKMAQKYAKKFNEKQVIILSIDKHGYISYVIHGSDDRLNALAEQIKITAYKTLKEWHKEEGKSGTGDPYFRDWQEGL